MVPKELCNPVKPLPPEEGAFDTYRKYGYMMFPQQRTIYSNIAKRIDPHSTVLEVGCGIGLGTALLDRSLTTKVIGTDNLADNVSIARALYPWIRFEVLDVCGGVQSLKGAVVPNVIVAIEVLEHVDNPQKMIENLCSFSLKEVWLSTPNGSGKKRPPDNPYHVCEYLPEEIREMVPDGWKVRTLEYQNFEPLSRVIMGEVNPLVYHFTKVVK